MDLIIGGRIDHYLDKLEAAAAPNTIQDLVDELMPLIDFMTRERYVFDLILRYSGAAGVAEIGPIALTFGRQIAIFERWLAETTFRRDITPDLQAEGVQAFMAQAMATKFCALHSAQSVRDRLLLYLNAWLTPCVLSE